MLAKTAGLTGFREYLSSYWGKWTSGSGPIVRGIVVAVTRLGMKAARTIGDIRASCEIAVRELSYVPRSSFNQVQTCLCNLLSDPETDLPFVENNRRQPKLRCRTP